MTPETGEMRPPRNGPRLRQTRPERRPGATGAGAGLGVRPANVPRATSRTVVRANMVDNSRVGGVAAHNNTGKGGKALAKRGVSARRLSQRHPIFPPPFPRLTPPTKVDFRRRDGDARLTGDVPANTLPMPTDSAHFGDAAVSPTLPSRVKVSVGVSRCVIPQPSVRLKACVESDWPTSTPSEALVVHRGEKS